jgi:hypothetical protein
MQSLAPTITVLVAVVLVKQVPIARHHQCFPPLVVSAEPQTSLVLMCITQQAAVAQVEPRVTGLQAAQAAVETAVDSTTTPLQQQVKMAKVAAVAAVKTDPVQQVDQASSSCALRRFQ